MYYLVLPRICVHIMLSSKKLPEFFISKYWPGPEIPCFNNVSANCSPTVVWTDCVLLMVNMACFRIVSTSLEDQPSSRKSHPSTRNLNMIK